MLSDVGKSFPVPGDKMPHVTLSGVNLSIRQGEIVAMVGPSGCGKSTILNLIAGFDRPTSGTVKVDGKVIAGAGPDRAVVFQGAALFPWMTVWENVILGPNSQGRTPSEYEPRARELLANVGLTGNEKKYPYQLSGGMYQRVQIARALLAQPDVLLMDEPFGALDAQMRLLMQELLLDLWQLYQPTILFITHDVQEAIFVSDRVCVMTTSPGRVTSVHTVPFGKPRSVDVLTSPVFLEIERKVLSEVHDAVKASLGGVMELRKSAVRIATTN